MQTITTIGLDIGTTFDQAREEWCPIPDRSRKSIPTDAQRLGYPQSSASSPAGEGPFDRPRPRLVAPLIFSLCSFLRPESDLDQSTAASYSFAPGGIVPAAGAGSDGGVVWAAGAAPLSPAASIQSPTQSLVPLTVPTSLQPIGACGLACTGGLLPTLGGGL